LDSSPLSISDKLSKAVAFDLYKKIRSGEYPVGCWLPSEFSLFSKYGVSRNTIREAVRMIRNAGLVTTIKGSGTRVISNVGNSEIMVFADEIFARSDYLRDLYDFRKITEVELCGKAASRRNIQDIELMQKNLDFNVGFAQINNCADAKSCFEFHILVANASHSDIGLSMLINLRPIVRWHVHHELDKKDLLSKLHLRGGMRSNQDWLLLLHVLQGVQQLHHQVLRHFYCV